MFAVIKTGGKQYHVAPEDVIRIEKVAGDAGETVTFGEVLLVGGDGEPQVGAPMVEGASVTGEIVEQARTRKIIIFKKRRRKNSRRRNGHRQHQTVVRITDILTAGAKAKKAAKPAKEETETAKPATADTAEAAPAASE
ncbi:ribosomal protein L21 [Rhodobium orientis]|uniref:Large ribosomal subunit protein bL21 n=1 Tax=Rhodobium orientis TaxID=34017 RepID=A0A327JPT1_9HYPH|nr:50S ribosomal protein L21 [Rhodobium orientis]MBB4303550.1 ribosomal protein L21 [Rhodobium orientis]MBK5950479.1 50S ribosomal protein L21 [Rhodobium orientis]RAI28307.1 50S ribosomal protein L21 [Rhodobium orientis]